MRITRFDAIGFRASEGNPKTKLTADEKRGRAIAMNKSRAEDLQAFLKPYEVNGTFDVKALNYTAVNITARNANGNCVSGLSLFGVKPKMKVTEVLDWAAGVSKYFK